MSAVSIEDVRVFGTRTNNAQLMADCHQLGYLPHSIFDATYGEGRFWKTLGEAGVVSNDLSLDAGSHYHDDFRSLTRWNSREFNAVVFDPPYKLNGTSTGEGPSASDDSYGVAGPYKTVDEKHGLIKDGIIECARISARFLLIKCMDQVCSGVRHWQTRIFANTAERSGFKLVDMLHVQGYRKQPEGREQHHARGDYSTLLVCERE